MDLERRARSFGAVAAAYERGRPAYPPEAVRWMAGRLGVGPGSDVLDLGAGTGKLTWQLVALGARVSAVEPLAEMRAELERAVPEAVALAGRAEAIPLADASVDAVTCAQAFHWFDAAAALAEMARVLRPRGGVGLVWNTRDEADALQREISGLIGARERVGEGEEELLASVERTGRFGGVTKRLFAHEQRLSRLQLVDRVLSMSAVASLPGAERSRVIDDVSGLVEGLDEPIRLSYVTEVFAFGRLA